MLRILIPVTVIVSLWTVGFYYAMIDEVEDEVDDQLDLYAEQIIRKQLRGEEVPTEDNATNDSFFFEEIAPEIKNALLQEKQRAAYESKINQLKILFPVDKF